MRKRLFPRGFHSNSKRKCTRKPWIQERLNRFNPHYLGGRWLLCLFFLIWGIPCICAVLQVPSAWTMNAVCVYWQVTVTELYKEPFQVDISPKELARLVSKQDGDGAASTQVLPHYGDFGAPRLWAPARRQTCDHGCLNKEAKKRRLRGKGNLTMVNKQNQTKKTSQVSTLVFVF